MEDSLRRLRKPRIRSPDGSCGLRSIAGALQLSLRRGSLISASHAPGCTSFNRAMPEARLRYRPLPGVFDAGTGKVHSLALAFPSEVAASSARDILDTYLHFRDGGRVDPVPVSDAFWVELAAGRHPTLDQGRSMPAFSFSEASSMWERHPGGEGLVMLLEGAATLLLDQAGQERTVELRRRGAYVLVPPGVWYTARTSVPTTMLFLTPGA